MPIECYRELLNLADKEEVTTGRMWYSKAHERIIKLSAESGVGLERVAGVVAVLSPMVEWSVNLRIAEKFIKSKGRSRGAGFRRNYKKAHKVLKGNMEVIRGPKVARFFRTLLDPDFGEAVIDSQMIGAYYNGQIDKQDIGKVNGRERKLSEIRDAISILAKERKEKVSSVQAIIWLTFKRMKGPYVDQLKLWR